MQAAREWGSDASSCDDLKSACNSMPESANPCRKTCNLDDCDDEDGTTTQPASTPTETLYTGPLNQWACEYTSGYGPQKSPHPCYQVALNEDGFSVPPDKFIAWLGRFVNETREGGRYKASVSE